MAGQQPGVGGGPVGLGGPGGAAPGGQPFTSAQQPPMPGQGQQVCAATMDRVPTLPGKT